MKQPDDCSIDRLRSYRGFTLIEVMITVVIVAILTAIALPSYTNYVIRSKRNAAQSQMLHISTLQQQFLMADSAYADKAKLVASGFTLPSEVSSSYTYDVVPAAGTPPSYLITFTPTGSQASDGALTLNEQGVKTPAAKWGK